MMEVHFATGRTHSGIDYTTTQNGGKPQAHQYHASDVSAFMKFMVDQYQTQMVFIRLDDTRDTAKLERAFHFLQNAMDPTVAHDAADADLFNKLLEILR